MKTPHKHPELILKSIACAFFFILFNLNPFQSLAQSRWLAPKDAALLKNPVDIHKGLSEAQTLYIANCSPCHGDKGKGNGPAAQALSPKPADHTSEAVQSQTDGTLFWKLSEGRNAMASYKNVFTVQQRWELVNYIRTLAKKH